MMGAAVAEMASLGLVIPFLTVLSNPTEATQSIYGLFAKQVLGISTTSGLIGLTCLVFGASGLISAALRIANIYCKGRVAAKVGIDLASSAYSRVLERPYQWHILQNSGDILNALTNFVNRSVMSTSLLDLAVTSLVSIGLMASLLILVGGNFDINIIRDHLLNSTNRTMKKLKYANKAIYASQTK